MIHNRSQAERANQRLGQYFFTPSTMRFFRSRIGKFYPVPGGAYFVTSEQQDGYARRYTIRWISEDGRVQTRYGYLNGFQRFASRTAANRIALRLQQVARSVSIETPAS